jgi:hypothetical protein
MLSVTNMSFVLSVLMLKEVMLSVIMLNAIMLNAFMLSFIVTAGYNIKVDWAKLYTLC